MFNAVEQTYDDAWTHRMSKKSKTEIITDLKDMALEVKKLKELILRIGIDTAIDDNIEQSLTRLARTGAVLEVLSILKASSNLNSYDRTVVEVYMIKVVLDWISEDLNKIHVLNKITALFLVTNITASTIYDILLVYKSTYFEGGAADERTSSSFMQQSTDI